MNGVSPSIAPGLSEPAATILAAVLQLPRAERFALTDAVVEANLQLAEEGIVAELERRRIAFDNGTSPGIEAEDLFEELRGIES